MSVPMRKAGGGGHYGVAQVRLTKGEVIIQDGDNQDRYVFPLDSTPLAKNDKSHLTSLLRAGKAGRVIYPKTTDRAERIVVVYPGQFEYAINTKGDVLYGLRPTNGSHLCRFVGFGRDDPKQPPSWKPHQSTFDKTRMDKQFDALFRTSDADEFPGLEVRWGFWRYNCYPDKNDSGQDVMGLSLLNPKAGAAQKAQYELLRCAGIIGRDDVGQEAVLMEVPGALENYLPALETILLREVGKTDFVLAFEQYKNDEGATKVKITGLYKQPGQDSTSKPRRKK